MLQTSRNILLPQTNKAFMFRDVADFKIPGDTNYLQKIILML